MQLSEDQVRAWREDGFVFVDGLLSPAEMAVVQAELPDLLALRRQEVVLEKDGETVRSLLNLHLYNAVFDALVRHPRLIGPTMQLLGSEVYIFQSILNLKHAFTGDVWQWHQDYPTYHADDGMLTPRVMNILLFIEDVGEFNGPLMLVPGTHEATFATPEVDRTTTSYPLRGLDDDTVARHAEDRGIVAPKGPAGSAIFMHTNLIHGSGPNMSPWGRALMSLTLNSTENKTVAKSVRPDYIVLDDFTPVVPLAEDCLTRAPA
ncbi:MAG: phytanoyl-CoA dioxygenase family protein [Alphaproteobacteria bacterium]|nr:phytanoyl-CoA dioxygenase family protein [Alphaproteobacteria bacterium]